MSDDLVTWLRAQLDNDEAHAQKDLYLLNNAKSGGQWRAHLGTNVASEVRTIDGELVAKTQHQDDAMVIARLVNKGRARAIERLAEVEAKRRLLDQFALRRQAVLGIDGCQTGGVWDDLLRLLALPYAERDGWREEWRP